MKISFQRRKQFYDKWDKQNYTKHIKRLEDLMKKDNINHSKNLQDQKAIHKLMQISHKSHKISGNHKNKQSRQEIHKDESRLIKFLKKLEFPTIGEDKSLKKQPKLSKAKSLDFKKFLENSILYQKIQNADSHYKKKQFDQTYNRLSQIRQNIKRIHKPNKNSVYLETIYKESSFLPINFPSYTYTHVTDHFQRRKIKYDQIYLKFQKLPFSENDKIEYTVQLLKGNKQIKLVSYYQLMKDWFLFKLPYEKTKNKYFIKGKIQRYANNDGNLLTVFHILPGVNTITTYYNGLDKLQLSSQFLCYSSWKTIDRSKKCNKQQQFQQQQHEINNSDNQSNIQIGNDFEALKVKKISIQTSKLDLNQNQCEFVQKNFSDQQLKNKG